MEWGDGGWCQQIVRVVLKGRISCFKEYGPRSGLKCKERDASNATIRGSRVDKPARLLARRRQMGLLQGGDPGRERWVLVGISLGKEGHLFL